MGRYSHWKIILCSGEVHLQTGRKSKVYQYTRQLCGFLLRVWLTNGSVGSVTSCSSWDVSQSLVLLRFYLSACTHHNPTVSFFVIVALELPKAKPGEPCWRVCCKDGQVSLAALHSQQHSLFSAKAAMSAHCQCLANGTEMYQTKGECLTKRCSLGAIAC